MATTPKQKCAESVYRPDGNWGQNYTCTRNAGFGPEEKYCRQHSENHITEGETVTWYQVSVFDYSCDITPVEVLKETEDFLLVKESHRSSRVRKSGSFNEYFQTREEAINFYRTRVEGLRSRADALERQINN